MRGGGSALSDFTAFDHSGRYRPPVVLQGEVRAEVPNPKEADQPAEEVRNRVFPRS